MTTAFLSQRSRLLDGENSCSPLATLEQTSWVILRLPEVQLRVGLSRSTIYERINPGSRHYDPTFPRPVPLGAPANSALPCRRRSAVGWIEAEIEAWIEQRIADRTSD